MRFLRRQGGYCAGRVYCAKPLELDAESCFQWVTGISNRATVDWKPVDA
jgi:hypothetical protein